MSLRARVTLGFTAVLAVALATAGTFLYVRFAGDLRRTQDDGLRARAAQLAAAAERPDPPRGLLPGTPGLEADEDVAQLVAGDGTVLAGSQLAEARPLLPAGRLRAAQRGEVVAERPGDAVIDEGLRLLAVPVAGAGTVAVAGASADEVAESRATLLTLEVAGLGAALLIGAAGAWLLAGRVVRPVAAALEREQRLLADASHELRTPLAVLKAELEVTRMEGGDPQAALASAEEEVDRMARLADDLLAVARADAHGVPLRRERIALDRVLERAARGVPDVAVHPCGVELDADPSALERAVRNLVENAARHGAPPVDVDARRHDGVVDITVRDRGPGIPRDFAPRAFDPFARADAGRAGPGAGLGLAIVAAVAAAHDGRVRLRDAHPGTAAVLTLPLRLRAPVARSRGTS